jgi:hypothetical protein
MSVLGKVGDPLVDDMGIWDGSGNPVPGVLVTALTIRLKNPSGTLVYERVGAVENVTTIPVSYTDIGNGEYRMSFTPDVVGDWIINVTHPTYFPWGRPTNYQVFAQLFDDINVDNLGPGNRVVEVTVQDDTTLAPIIATWVEVYDATSTTRIAFGYTDSSGQITFQLFDGSYKVYLSKIGQYVFTVPEDLTVSASPPPPDVQVTYQGTMFDPGTPPSSDQCIVYGWEQDIQGTGLAVEISAQIVGDDNFLEANPHITGDPVTTTSSPTHVNGNGYWSLTLFRSVEYASGPGLAMYNFTIGDKTWSVEIPDAPTVAFATLVDP